MSVRSCLIGLSLNAKAITLSVSLALSLRCVGYDPVKVVVNITQLLILG